MTPTLYMAEYSAPVRAVLMTAKALGVTLIHKEVDLSKEEHLTPAFLEMNPQHTIPTLVDKGLVIWDSHAIIAYLVGKYGNDDSLYPRDVAKRAIVDQRLHFDSGVILSLLRQIVRPMYFGAKTIPENKLEEVYEAYDFLEKFLAGRKFVAGDTPTVADFSLVSTVTSMDTFIPVPVEKCPNINEWLKRSKATCWYPENEKGLKQFGEIVKKMMSC